MKEIVFEYWKTTFNSPLPIHTGRWWINPNLFAKLLIPRLAAWYMNSALGYRESYLDFRPPLTRILKLRGSYSTSNFLFLARLWALLPKTASREVRDWCQATFGIFLAMVFFFCMERETNSTQHLDLLKDWQTFFSLLGYIFPLALILPHPRLLISLFFPLSFAIKKFFDISMYIVVKVLHSQNLK